MRRTIVRLAVAVLLVLVGFAAGRAQSANPDFELVVSGSAESTRIECRRGCTLAWVERGVNPAATPMSSFSYGCKGAGVTTCTSGRVGGWLTKAE